MNRIAALDDRSLGRADGAVQGLDRLLAAFGKEVPGRLKFEERGLEALQQRVVQFAGDARPLLNRAPLAAR